MSGVTAINFQSLARQSRRAEYDEAVALAREAGLKRLDRRNGRHRLVRQGFGGDTG